MKCMLWLRLVHRIRIEQERLFSCVCKLDLRLHCKQEYHVICIAYTLCVVPCCVLKKFRITVKSLVNPIVNFKGAYQVFDEHCSPLSMTKERKDSKTAVNNKNVIVLPLLRLQLMNLQRNENATRLNSSKFLFFSSLHCNRLLNHKQVQSTPRQIYCEMISYSVHIALCAKCTHFVFLYHIKIL